MARNRTEVEMAAGKLISAIQKEWGNGLGGSTSKTSEHVMNLAHDLFQAETAEAMLKVLGSRSIKQYLGELWVTRHPSIERSIANLEAVLKNEKA